LKKHFKENLDEKFENKIETITENLSKRNLFFYLNKKIKAVLKLKYLNNFMGKIGTTFQFLSNHTRIQGNFTNNFIPYRIYIFLKMRQNYLSNNQTNLRYSTFKLKAKSYSSRKLKKKF